MSLVIPVMQYDKKIDPEEGKALLCFAEQYTEKFNDKVIARVLEKVNSIRFLGKNQSEVIKSRRENFSDNDIISTGHYINKYRETITTLMKAIKMSQPFSQSKGKLKDLLSFYKVQGYLTKKQRGLIYYLSKDIPGFPNSINSPELQAEIEDCLHHHIKKDFMKAQTTEELAEILTKKTKSPPIKKRIFTLSQIRNKLSN